jgi:5'-methylthioadenosine phosphorylase
MVTDYDCWRAGEVSVPDILRVMTENVGKAQRLLSRTMTIIPRKHPVCPIGSDRALEAAVITTREARDTTLMSKFDAIAGRLLGNS